MSKSLVPKPDANPGVVDTIVNDGVTVAITVGTIAAYSFLPLIGWLALPVGGLWLGARAIKKGLKNR